MVPALHWNRTGELNAGESKSWQTTEFNGPSTRTSGSIKEMKEVMSATTTIPLLRKSVGGSITLSILLIAAGLIAMASPLAAGIAANIALAWLLIFSGGAHLVFAWHTRTTRLFAWELLVGLLYLGVGAYLLMHPLAGLASLTFALAYYLYVEALLEFLVGFAIRRLPGSGWLLFDGVVTLILAIVIWRTWPSNSEWVVGTLVGISMLFSGISRLSFSLTARSALSKLA